VCDLETSRIGASYIYDISNLRVNIQQLYPLTSLYLCVLYLSRTVDHGCLFLVNGRSDGLNERTIE
jgi:hypothetical protein